MCSWTSNRNIFTSAHSHEYEYNSMKWSL